MNVIGGRGGPFTAFFGLLAFFIAFGFKVAMYVLAVALILVLLIAKGIQLLWLHQRAKKLHEQEEAEAAALLANPPMPLVSRVGPRDWHPPH